MSVENATNFLIEMQKDQAAYDGLAKLDGPSVEKLAADKGMPCSVNAIKSVLEEAMASEALSDEQLEAVAGGGGGGSVPGIWTSDSGSPTAPGHEPNPMPKVKVGRIIRNREKIG